MSRRYPLQPLAQLAGLSKTGMQRRIAVGGRDWMRYWDEGVSWKVADRAAARCGFHPAEVWPEWVDDAVAEAQRPCDDCGDPFVPARRDGRFCSPACYRRWWGREATRRRRQRPELAEANRERRRAYYAANGDYERARERRYYAQNREEILSRRRRTELPTAQPQGWCPSVPHPGDRRISTMEFSEEVA